MLGRWPLHWVGALFDLALALRPRMLATYNNTNLSSQDCVSAARCCLCVLLMQLRIRMKDTHAMQQVQQQEICEHMAVEAALSISDIGESRTDLGQKAGLQSVIPEAGRSSMIRDSSQKAAQIAEALPRPSSSSSSALQELVAEHLGLVPTEEGRQMVHYVIPQTLAPQLQLVLEMLDDPNRQQQLGLAEVHVSLATLEEVFLAVVKQVRVLSQS